MLSLSGLALTRHWYLRITAGHKDGCQKGRGGGGVRASSCRFFFNYTVQCRRWQRTHTHPYERTHINPTLSASSKIGSTNSRNWHRHLTTALLPATRSNSDRDALFTYTQHWCAPLNSAVTASWPRARRSCPYWSSCPYWWPSSLIGVSVC